MRSIRSKITVLNMVCILACTAAMAGIGFWLISRLQAQSSDQIISLICLDETSKINRDLIDIEGSVDACAEIVQSGMSSLDNLQDKKAFDACMAEMERLMMDIMYEIPSDETIVSCTITKDSVENGAPPRIEHGEKPPLPAAPKAPKTASKTGGTRGRKRKTRA